MPRLTLRVTRDAADNAGLWALNCILGLSRGDIWIMVWLVTELWEIPDKAFSHWGCMSRWHLSLNVGSGFLVSDCVLPTQSL